MGEPFGGQPVQNPLPAVAKRRMPEIVPEGDCLDQIFIQPKGAPYGPGNLRNFQRVRQPGSVVISLRLNKNLRLVLHPSKRFTVQYAVAIPLIDRPNLTGFLHPIPATAFGAFRRIGG